MKKYFLIKVTGFTLAEVLITLTIIGVIAALTIPSLIQNIQDQQYRTAYKRIYSDLNQATSKLLIENAGDFTYVFTDTDVLRDDYARYFSYTQKCSYGGNSAGNCWSNDNVTRMLDGSIWGYTSKFTSSIVLSNGAFLKFEMNGSNDCNKTNWWGNVPKCGLIYIDVNGFKEPNMFGKDTYMIQITKNGITPMGTGALAGSCNTSSTGLACASLYLQQ